MAANLLGSTHIPLEMFFQYCMLPDEVKFGLSKLAYFGELFSGLNYFRGSINGLGN